MKSLTISINIPFPPPQRPSKKTLAWVVALGLLAKEIAHILKSLGHLTLGLLPNTTTRSIPPQSPPAHQWLATGHEDLHQLETRFLAEKDPVIRQRLMAIVDGMEVS